MRLKEIEKNLENIDFEDKRLETHPHGNDIKLSNINNFKFFLQSIETIDIYQDKIELLKQSSIYETTKNTVIVDETTAMHINDVSQYLIDSALSLQLVFNQLLPRSNENSISIKLPEPTDLEALNKTMQTIQKYISQLIVNDKINGNVKVNHWEFGSFWIDLALDTEVAVALVSSTMWASAVISKKIKENKILDQQIRSLEMKNDSLEDFLEKQKKLTNKLIDNEAQGVLDEHFEKDDFEQLERIKGTIKTFAKLIQDGAEIHPSLMASEKVQDSFPNYKNLDMIISKIKQIEDKSEHEDDNT